ncbi:MAG: tRNA (guanosine(46)-N7)-methyltransferase TrmB [Hyphomicrobiales bacterium]|nr:MAG: tRNA (guanosine(46)-N7)-methyltransferase TrmB [Hyphomicrobiales bacterium]
MIEKQRAPTLYGRNKGHKLKARQQGLMDTLLPQLAVDPTAPAPARVADLFPVPVDEIWLEAGFGGGEHMIHQAETHDDVGIIGCEPFINGMAKAVSAIDLTGLENIRLYNGDATDVLDWLPEASLSRMYLLYPDPWPKRRHWKRRFISAEMLDRVARALKPGAEFRVASDIPHYIAWTLAHLRDHPAFEWTARKADDWREPYDGWPGTRYEAKAIREGRTPTYLTFKRV